MFILSLPILTLRLRRHLIPDTPLTLPLYTHDHIRMVPTPRASDLTSGVQVLEGEARTRSGGDGGGVAAGVGFGDGLAHDGEFAGDGDLVE